MDIEKVVSLIDEDIKIHHTKASGMLSVVEFVLFVAFFCAVLYILPAVAKNFVPGFEKESGENNKAYQLAIDSYNKKHGAKFKYISESTYDDYLDNGKVTDYISAAREISKMEHGTNIFLKVASTISKISIEDKKLELILKTIPLILGAILAGYLISYRLHVITAKELTLKKIEVLVNLCQKDKAVNEYKINGVRLKCH